ERGRRRCILPRVHLPFNRHDLALIVAASFAVDPGGDRDGSALERLPSFPIDDVSHLVCLDFRVREHPIDPSPVSLRVRISVVFQERLFVERPIFVQPAGVVVFHDLFLRTRAGELIKQYYIHVPCQFLHPI
ncbi:hypothetical protein KW786_02820, partial [Candidatus Parcubacteria bacterium]|nr:hypothetical protein [Candidatus Parcubacteria bacterium]